MPLEELKKSSLNQANGDADLTPKGESTWLLPTSSIGSQLGTRGVPYGLLRPGVPRRAPSKICFFLSKLRTKSYAGHVRCGHAGFSNYLKLGANTTSP